MANFVRRTTAPTTSDAEYYANNPFYLNGYGMPNCTTYAWGRMYELTGQRPRLSTGNAENWWGYTGDGYARGSTPKLGAIICWRKGNVDASDGAGHVAVVEHINADGSIITSESGWGDSRFWWERTRQPGGNWSASSGYTFQGFIYCPIEFDSGSGGSGGSDNTYISANRFLTEEEKKTNARYIWNYLGSRGWTMNAVAGMLGNMETESSINPGIWQDLNSGNMSGGFGLVQWTPATKLINWANNKGLVYTALDTQLERIIYEQTTENGQFSSAGTSYNMTFTQFKNSTLSPYDLGLIFLACYERPADPNQPWRGTAAQTWYEYLQTIPAPSDPSGGGVSKKGMSLLLMFQAIKRKV